MPSVLRELQAEWNAMVPRAQAQGIRRVRLLGGGDVERGPLETIAYRRAKVEWLRALLGSTAATPAGAGPAADPGAFDTVSFGVELECILPTGWTRGRLAAAITGAGVPCSEVSYGHTTPTSWKVTTDASLGYERGVEVVSPPLRGTEGFRQLKVACDVLTRIGARVDRRCGLHVHVGARSEGVDFFKNLVTLYASAQSAIDTFMPPSRRGRENMFCAPLPSAVMASNLVRGAGSIAAVARAIGQHPNGGRDSTRYCKLNLKSYWAYGTVEFRHHAGTVDARKAENWVKLCLRMVLTARAGERQASSVDELMEAVGATEDEREYFRGRVAFFNRDVAADHFAAYGSATHPRGGHPNQQGRA